jgi:hypothetical protein
VEKIVKVLGLVTFFIRPEKEKSCAVLIKERGGVIIIKNVQCTEDLLNNISKRKVKIIPITPFYFQTVNQNQFLLDLVREDRKQWYAATEIAYIFRIINNNETELLELVNKNNLKNVKDFLTKISKYDMVIK